MLRIILCVCPIIPIISSASALILRSILIVVFIWWHSTHSHVHGSSCLWHDDGGCRIRFLVLFSPLRSKLLLWCPYESRSFWDNYRWFIMDGCSRVFILLVMVGCRRCLANRRLPWLVTNPRVRYTYVRKSHHRIIYL